MIELGMTGTYKTTVSGELTAKTMGSGELDVFATPALVAALEAASVNAIADGLDNGYTSVGCGISISHSAPSVVGAEITATAVVKETDGRKVVFTVRASDENGIIGEGEHTRVVVSKAKFMSKAIIRSESNVN